MSPERTGILIVCFKKRESKITLLTCSVDTELATSNAVNNPSLFKNYYHDSVYRVYRVKPIVVEGTARFLPNLVEKAGDANKKQSSTSRLT